MGVDANTLLRLTDLTVDFESQEGIVHAVDKVSFSVASGELVGLVGESGCGKSVTASAILGLTRMVNNATISGTIEFLGRDLVALPESAARDIRGKDISMSFQDPRTNPQAAGGFRASDRPRCHLPAADPAAQVPSDPCVPCPAALERPGRRVG